MTTKTTLLTNANIATMAGPDYGLMNDGAVLMRNGVIEWVGLHGQAPQADLIYDCEGQLLTPGLIDCHTHIVYGGNRAAEFEMRLQGASYEEVARAGGGIVSTVKATRTASIDELVTSALARLDALLNEGVTTVEIKSGYGLDVETECNMLRAARLLGKLRPVSIVTSFLGGHTCPVEFNDDRAGYVRLVCEQALPAVAEENLADAVDGFCENIAFNVAEIEQIFKAATALGLPVKLHAEQLSNLGGAIMAAQYDALSVDHIEYLDDAGIAAIAQSGSVAVLLPGAFYYLRETQSPPVDGLRAKQVPIAIASDLNPGSSPVHSLLTVMNMACVLFRLTPEEALRGVTLNAARALGLTDRGTIGVGQRGDLALWNVATPGELSYPLGFNPCCGVWQDGKKCEINR